jgi:phosphocarrier protein HPr
MSDDVVREAVIKNSQGLHMRPAMGLMERSREFACQVFIGVDGEEVDGKGILGLIELRVGCGQTIQIRCVGEDAVTAADTLADYIESMPESFQEDRVE